MKFELEIDLQPNQVQKLKRHLEDFCYNNFCGQPVLRQTEVSGALPPDEKFFELTEKICYQQFAADPMGDIVAKMSLIKQFINEQCLGGNDR